MSDFKASNLNETENVPDVRGEPVTTIDDGPVVKVSEETGICKIDDSFGIHGPLEFLSEDLSVAHLCMTAPDRDPLIQRLAGDQFRESAVSLLNELAPRNASERMVATLAIATWNCALTALADGSRQDVPAEVRRLNMGLGFQGTGIASKAITTLQEMQSGNPKCVSVGKVNVEAGGQAIVGHVEAGRGPTKHRNREPIRRVKKAKRGG